MAEAEDWLGQRGDELREKERQFIRASKAFEERRFRQLVTVATVLGVLLVVAVAGVLVASWQTRQAEFQADVALTRQLLARASELQESQPDASLLVNVEACKEHRPPSRKKLALTFLPSLLSHTMLLPNLPATRAMYPTWHSVLTANCWPQPAAKITRCACGMRRAARRMVSRSKVTMNG